MAKLIPTREELGDFIVLLKRYASACRAGSGCGADGNPELTRDYCKLMSMLREEVSTRLVTLDFRATYGWPGSLGQALESLRLGGASSRPSKSHHIKHINGFIRVRVFNLNPPKFAMVNLDRSIEDIEAIVSAKSGALGEREPPPLRESERQIVETLRAVGHRLTTRKLLDEMSKRGPTSESTVKKRLAEMVKTDRLDSDPKAKPPGYGLPEWDLGSPGSIGS